MISPELLRAAEIAMEALESCGLSYCVVGGMAMPAWRHIRATQDADFLLVADPGARRAVETQVVDALRARGLAHMQRADRAVIEGKVVLFFYFPVRDLGLSLRVDVIVAPGGFHAEVVARRRMKRINDREAWVASCEDLVLLKMLAGRPIDIADARALRNLNAEGLDKEYIQRHVRALGLEKAWREVQAPAESW